MSFLSNLAFVPGAATGVNNDEVQPKNSSAVVIHDKKELFLWTGEQLVRTTKPNGNN